MFTSIKAEGPMSRAVIFLIIIVVIIAGALVFLSSQAREVPTHSIQVDVTNAAGH
jgi:preprotein translocase subunit SecY